MREVHHGTEDLRRFCRPLEGSRHCPGALCRDQSLPVWQWTARDLRDVSQSPSCLSWQIWSRQSGFGEGGAPLLVSRKALQSLRGKLDFSKNELTVFDNEEVIPLQVNSAGQYVVPLLGNVSEEASQFEEVMMSETAAASEPSVKADDPVIDAEEPAETMLPYPNG